MKTIDLTGTKFGNLTALYSVKLTDRIVWECACDCGGRARYSTSQLRAGNVKTCKNAIHACSVQADQKYGKLTVIAVYRNTLSRRHVADTLCSCGNTKTVAVKDLQRKTTTHCGCSRDVSKLGKPMGVAVFNSRVSSYKSNAKHKQLEFTLTEVELKTLFKGNCFFCGTPPDKTFTKKGIKGAYIYNGIARIDSTKGYSNNNVNSCCSTCNYLKSNSTNEAFLAKIYAIAKHQKMVGA